MLISIHRYGCILHTRYRRGYADIHIQIWMYSPYKIKAWICRYPYTDVDVFSIQDIGLDMQISICRCGCIIHTRYRHVPWPQGLSVCCLFIPTFCPCPLVNSGQSSNSTLWSFWECHINGNMVGSSLLRSCICFKHKYMIIIFTLSCWQTFLWRTRWYIF